MNWAVMHPLDYFVIMIRTFLRQPDMVFGIIGKYLGWNRAAVPDAVCGLFYFLMGISIFVQGMEDDLVRPLKGFERCWIWAPFILMALILPASILNYTHWGRDSIEGLQGRYFLPLLIPLLMMSFHNLRGKASLRKLDTSVFLWGTGTLHLISIYYIWLTFLGG